MRSTPYKRSDLGCHSQPAAEHTDIVTLDCTCGPTVSMMEDLHKQCLCSQLHITAAGQKGREMIKQPRLSHRDKAATLSLSKLGWAPPTCTP